ncbi:hypothetical protein ACFFX1_19290 [Dactylosporangium sucinum]|uniref:Uncharacterized protein n=1 Tax=Dactylosporangium sucinum TaxID=1424081 RepID=A0A917WYX3_9ACTN|nr:hypothetical protein [Dactylosporangium sucinum]GGM47546.1 hypothetical protein GCM10007977_056450 [Dactylosporangium sucinum]
MSVNGLEDALGRSNLAAPSSRPDNWQHIVAAAVGFVPNYSDTVLEISKAGLHKMPGGERLGTIDAFVFLFPDHLAIAREIGVIRKRIDVQGEAYGMTPAMYQDERELNPNKAGEFAIQFVGAGRVPAFRLAWYWWRKTLANKSAVALPAATERDRIFAALHARGVRHA